MLDLHLEAQVEQLYETIELPTSWLARLRGELETEITLRQHRNASEREFLTRKLAKAEAERRKPPDAYYAGAIDVATIKMEEARIGSDIREAEERLAAVDAHLAEWQVILETAMRFATNCARAYVPASAPTRRELRDVVETRRLELPTSCVQSRRSSQLSYVPAGRTVRWHSIVGLLTDDPARLARGAERVVRTHRRDPAAPSHGPRDPNSQLLVTCRSRSSVRFASALPLSVPATASIAWMISLPISSRRSASAVASAATTALWRRSTASASE